MHSARDAVLDFANRHAKIVEEYRALVAEANSLTKQAKAAFVLHNEVLGSSYEGFAKSGSRAVDAKRLVELMPDLIDEVEYTMKIDAFDKLVRDGVIDDDLIQKVVFEKPRVSGNPEL